MQRTASETYRRIWEVVRRIPRGRVATYGQIAALAGKPGQPRLAGYAMRHVPEGLGIPWQRVINARGEISPRASGAVEASLHRALLEDEGIQFDAGGRVDLTRYLWQPRPRRVTHTAAPKMSSRCARPSNRVRRRKSQ